jgi:protein phosphatase
MIQKLNFKSVGRSDLGLARENNEDSGYIGKNFLLVADGMGGHAAGELASATAVSVISGFDKNFNDSILSPFDIVYQISNKIKKAIEKDLSRSGMGTTLSAIYLTENKLNTIHVGDSRIYLIRDKNLQMISKDQTYIQNLIDSGEVTEEDAKTHPQRSLLLQAIDGTSGIIPEVKSIDVKNGDKVLLCSDGLTNVVNDLEIQNIINSFDSVGAVSALIEKALEQGGPDNITLIITEITDKKIEEKNVVLGAAAEPRNRILLPDLDFPTDIHPFITSEFPALKNLNISKKVKLLMLFAVLVIPIYLGFNFWISKQFYVSNLGENIAIFQGLKVEIGSLALSQPVQSFNLETKVLTEEDLKLVEEGIDANSLTEARFIVRRLDQRALCNRDSSFSFCFEVMQSIRPK